MKLKDFFKTNGYPNYFIDKYVRIFLNRLYTPKSKSYDVPKDVKYVKLPYLGKVQSEELELFLRNILHYCYPQIKFNFIFSNGFTISSFFRIKDKIPEELYSNIIYKYECNICNELYIGSSCKQAKIRFSQHMGISHRTGRHLTVEPQSSIRDHCQNTKHHLKKSNFSIVSVVQNPMDLKVLESFYINQLKPNLNKDKFSTPLYFK